MSLVQVDQVETTQLVVRQRGTPVNIGSRLHARCNHYIKQSRPYFPNLKLRTYIECCCLIPLSAMFFAGSLSGGFMVLVNSASMNRSNGAGTPEGLLPGCLVATLPFCFIFMQHEWVNQKSLRVIRKQPVFGSQPKLNWFYEVTLTELKGVALANYQSGIGFIRVTEGKIKFQAFNFQAAKEMCYTPWLSRSMLVLFLLSLGVNIYCLINYD